jgi:hypothetical protein
MSAGSVLCIILSQKDARNIVRSCLKSAPIFHKLERSLDNCAKFGICACLAKLVQSLFIIQSNPPNQPNCYRFRKVDFPNVTPAAGLHLTISDHVSNEPAAELMAVNEPSIK